MESMSDDAVGSELGHFLRRRRAMLDPVEAGVVSYGQRRVPGLRREELAQLAGVSVTYYTRLEQGQSRNASAAVIESIARAMGLDDDESAHLRDLARPTLNRVPRRRRPAKASAGLRQLVDAVAVPAVLLGRHNDVLAWNALGHRLLAGHLDPEAPQGPERPNLTRMLFLDPHTRDLYPQWDDEARRAVAALRLAAGRYPDDRDLAELIGELSMKDQKFAALWSAHPVANCTSGSKLFRHPEVGDLTLEFEALHLADRSGHRILMYSAVAGSSHEAALELLGRNG